MGGLAEKAPLSTIPDTSRRPGSMATLTAVFGLVLPPAFTTTDLPAPRGKVKRAAPVRVCVSLLSMRCGAPGSNVTVSGRARLSRRDHRRDSRCRAPADRRARTG